MHTPEHHRNDPLGNFEALLPQYLARAEHLDFHDLDDRDALFEVLRTDNERLIYATFLALQALSTSERAEVVRLSRTPGASSRFGDTALIALYEFNNNWPDIKTRLEQNGIALTK